MTRELSEKELKKKEQIERYLSSFDMSWEARGRRMFGMLPSDPRCASCLAPFDGLGGTFVRAIFNKRRSTMNPLMCSTCEEVLKRLRFGVETEMSMLFADIRGSTPLAGKMNPIEFRQLIDRFYSETTHVLMHSMAIIDKLAGDAVSGYYLPGTAGVDFARSSVEAAEQLLRVTGHGGADGPWAPVGVGVHTGVAYFGAVGEVDGMIELTALGDAVNVASRLANHAATGEVVLSDSTVEKSGMDTTGLERRTLELKGKSEPMDVWVMNVKPD
jgi:adenylate cyclase